MYSKFGQFINGKWQASQNNETYDVLNPATEEVLGKASKAGEEDVNKALKSAEKGLEVWRNTPPWQRSKIIRKIADLMRERTDVLAKTSVLSLIRSAIFLIIFDLCQGGVFLQTSRPFSADLSALFTSSSPAFDALPKTSSVAGFKTS